MPIGMKGFGAARFMWQSPLDFFAVCFQGLFIYININLGHENCQTFFELRSGAEDALR
jgi:hypothetical protein